ncbi:hypothetical protein BGZ65_013021 [Modicella reniformis]|uniref:Uncharacterized protein n=1 Tax=Modicella reniformis TaxID=1440133 RepID=A0A9P6IQ63_9FUNG|nr:hypothetical protein BGZ65_013021 [Modicella reniformis]
MFTIRFAYKNAQIPTTSAANRTKTTIPQRKNTPKVNTVTSKPATKVILTVTTLTVTTLTVSLTVTVLTVTVPKRVADAVTTSGSAGSEAIFKTHRNV